MDLATRLSLLDRLKQASADADWRHFYAKYNAVILSFARKQGADDHTAEDVLQESMMVVIRKLPTFDYDAQQGRFRNWLLTIVTHKVREAKRRSHVDRLLSMDALSADDEDSLHGRLAAEDSSATENLEDSWRQSLLDEALRRVLADSRTKPESVEVFRACALEGQPVGEVAARFGLKENAVYQIKNRMMTRLQEIVAAMEGGQAAPPPIAGE
ncbi:MAG: sigma-70 family RNA polymerase sigma factor [Chthoniobacteraceae bacterium]